MFADKWLDLEIAAFFPNDWRQAPNLAPADISIAQVPTQ